MKLKATAAVLSAAALFAACSDEVVNVNDEAKEKATISFKVVDKYSGEAIQGVSVKSVLDNKTSTTNELGIVSWGGKAIGEYKYEFSAEGYATIEVEAFSAEVGKGDVARVPDVFQEVRMVPGGLSVKGVVLYTDKKDVRKGAADVTVHAACGINEGMQFVPSEISVQTDKTGEYEFTDLPSGVGCSFYVGQVEVDGDLYEGSSTANLKGVRGAKTASVASISLQKVTSDIELISDNLTKIDSTTALKFVFSAKVNKDSLDEVYVLTGSKYVLTNVSVGEDGKTVIVKPFSKKWEDGRSYAVTGTVYSLDGATYNFNKANFTVGGSSVLKAPGQVSDLKAVQDEDRTYYIDLTWTAPKEDVNGYFVFYKTDKMADWEECDTFTAGYGTSSTPAKIYKDDLGTFKSVEFMVLPFVGTTSDYKIADKSKAKIVKFTESAGEEIIVK